MLKSLVGVAAVALALASQTALAHAHLTGQTPAADSTAQTPAVLRLKFSEGVEPAFTTVTLSLEGEPVTVKTLATAPGDNTELVVTPDKPLAPGRYQVKWRAVSVDTHHSEGQYGFTVAP
ncbi:copper homeostasis periplasmic binding protein CopC [Pseudomonas massiliensis]|uniref:copper homeostasis periplasmic binding protein CopC n=1 Tax=Pseudomonas massiliensis TaxID=522492 RepID=UPI00058B2488|nr:copper homeostasis periplasmic binding protein CopC [Pseudomonas massiliensis]